VARRFARNIPIGSASAVWPKLNADVTVYAPGEGGTITASNPTLSNVKVVPTKLAALVAISSELAEDSAVAIGELVGQSIARAFAKAEDQATFLGDGSSTYWGMVGLTGAFQSLASYSSQSANVLLGGLLTATGNAMSEVVIGDFTKMVGALPTYTQDVAWYCSRQFQWATMMRLALAAGGVTAAEYERSAGQSFLSYPVRTVDVMPKTDANSQIGCFFGDLSQGVYLGVRRSMAIEQDASVYFATDQLAIRGTERVGVNAFGFGSTTAAGPVLAMISLAS
jgi:HK97 family phage major capsid protein